MRILLLLFTLGLLYQTWATNCVNPGSFPQPRDPTCTKYFTCRLFLGSYYIKDNFTCGTFEKFNPTTQQCDYGSVCINNFCDNQAPNQVLPDPNALNSTCRSTIIQCVGIINQYPTVVACNDPSGCC